MKTMIALMALFTSFAAYADVTADTPCQRQILGEALAERARLTTLEFLLASDFSVISFNKNSEGPGYYVGIEMKNRNEAITVTTSYRVTVKDPKTCKVSVKMMAD